MKKLSSYSSIYSIDHKVAIDLLSGEVIIEEKVDGSQFSFSKVEGEMVFKSKNKELYSSDPDKMFKNGVDSILEIQDKIPEGLTFRAEYLQKPKQNVLAYSRRPKHHVIVFDVMRGEEDYLSRIEKEVLCESIGLECVPIFFKGMVKSIDHLKGFLDKESILGGAKIEGVVVKPYKNDLFGRDKKLLVAKLVCEKFKERHNKEWKSEKGNKSGTDILTSLTIDLRTEARWQKAVQHLKESGELIGEPQDIPKVLREIGRDVKSEEEEYIKDKLFNWAWPQLSRAINRGVPEWYKEMLQGSLN